MCPVFSFIIWAMFSPFRPFPLLPALMLFLGLAACSSVFSPTSTPTPPIPTDTPPPPTPTPPPLAATVNGEYLTRAEFEEELARYRSAQETLGRAVSDEDADKTVLDDMIAQMLMAQSARAQGFELDEAETQSRLNALAEQTGGPEALAKWEADHGYTETSFNASLKRAAEAAWMRDKIIAEVPLMADQVHIRQILTYNEADARQALESLNGGTDFDELASEYDPVTRGELGWVPRGYLLDADLEAAAFSLEVGGVSDVIATPAGFHILKVLAREQHELSPDALLTLQEQALKDWVEAQRQKSEIIIAP